MLVGGPGGTVGPGSPPLVKQEPTLSNQTTTEPRLETPTLVTEDERRMWRENQIHALRALLACSAPVEVGNAARLAALVADGAVREYRRRVL